MAVNPNIAYITLDKTRAMYALTAQEVETITRADAPEKVHEIRRDGTRIIARISSGAVSFTITAPVDSQEHAILAAAYCRDNRKGWYTRESAQNWRDAYPEDDYTEDEYDAMYERGEINER